MRIPIIAAAMLAVMAIAPMAEAKKVKARQRGNYTERPLTTSKGDIQVFMGPLANPKFGTFDETGLTMLNVPEGSENIWFFNAGASYGITSDLEAGVFLPPMQVSPTADAGDLPFFLSWASRDDDMDFGARATVSIPTQGEENGSFWRVNPGLHVLLRFEGARMDLGGFFPMIFTTFGDESQTLVGLNVPLRVAFDVGKSAFAAIDTGLRKIDFDLENDLFMPLGLFGGYTIKKEGVPLIDITGSFMWQGFLWASAPEGAEDIVLEDLFTVSLGLNVHFDLSNRKKD